MQFAKKISHTLIDSFRHIPPSLKLAWRSSKKLCITIGILTLFAAILPILVAILGKWIVDAIMAHDFRLTVYWVIAEALIIAFQAAILRGLFLGQGLLGAKLGADVNIMILEKAVQLELRHFENSDIYDSLTRARQQASVRPVAMVTDTLQLLQNALTFLGYVGLLASFSAWIVLGLIAAAIPATVAEMRFSNAAFRMRNRRSPDNRRLNYLEYVLANDEHAKEVKVMGLSDLFLQRYKSLAYRFYEEDKRLSTSRSIWAYVLSLLATATFYVSYGVMAGMAALGKATLGQLTLYLMAFRQGQQAFQSCLTAVGSMYESNLYMSNLFEFLNIQTLESEDALKKATHPAPPTSHSGIRFENVGFHYNGSDKWVLRNISLEIPAGKSLALVGHNGAGKSTFIKLLCRLYDPSEGRILLDGIDLKEWDLHVLRRRIGVVFQDFNQYQLTFQENVGVGSIDHVDDVPQIRRSVVKGGAEEVAAGLHSDIATPLGRWFHEGVELSGGQWQKVALARGFMREDADVLIFDEPTAALDADAEQVIFERFRQLTAGKTSILISHRFPTVRMADRIVVLEHGQILEQGTHDELILANGTYHRLFNLQAQGYL